MGRVLKPRYPRPPGRPTAFSLRVETLENTMNPTMKHDCQIHGRTEYWQVKPGCYICSQCMQEIMVKLIGSVGYDLPEIEVRDGIYTGAGTSGDTWIKLEQEHLDEYHTVRANASHYPNPRYPRYPPYPGQPASQPADHKSPLVDDTKLLCEVCGQPMTIDKEVRDDEYAKCGNLMCDSFNIPISIRQVG